MALKGRQQQEGLDLTFPTLDTSERGGILSIVAISGISAVQYVNVASGARPLGIQLNDVEHLDLSRQYWPESRRVGVPMDIVGVGTDGDFETDWLSISGVIQRGDAAYVGPSGTITNISTLGNVRVGTFLSALTVDPHTVIKSGMGFSSTIMEPRTHNIVTDNNPADQVLVVSPGFAVVRVSQGVIMRSQASLGV